MLENKLENPVYKGHINVALQDMKTLIFKISKLPVSTDVAL